MGRSPAPTSAASIWPSPISAAPTCRTPISPAPIWRMPISPAPISRAPTCPTPTSTRPSSGGREVSPRPKASTPRAITTRRSARREPRAQPRGRFWLRGPPVATGGGLTPGPPPPASAAEMTDTALVLAVDVSESVTPERYALQMEGIARAFHDREVQGSILSGAHHSMFVTLVEWSNKPFVVLPWTLIASAEEADAFADRLRQAPRADSQFTCMSRALEIIEGKVLPV